MSASGLAINRNRNEYDVFALPCSPQSYIPNLRLQMLLKHYGTLSNDTDGVCSFEYALRTNLKVLHTWKYSFGGTETSICDPNLAKYLSRIKDCIDSSFVTIVMRDSVPFELVLAAQTSKTEHHIQWNNHVLLGSEAKGIDSSQYEAMVQGFQISGDSAVHMWRCGLSTHDAVVPLILSYSDSFCIYAVYLIPECYPVLVQLSPPLTYLTFEGRCALARWGIALARFAEETVNCLRNPQNKARTNLKSGVYISPSFFYKPLRDYHKSKDGSGDIRVYSGSSYWGDHRVDNGSSHRLSLESLMVAYQCLSVVPRAHDFFLFPLGVISYPSEEAPSIKSMICDIMKKSIQKYFLYHDDLLRNGCPVVVYDLLTPSCWSNKKPPPYAVESYIACVKSAVAILNKACIAHLDLRPANILWRVTPPLSDIDSTLSAADVDRESESAAKRRRVESGTAVMVEIRVIDLEDAVPFGFNFQHTCILRSDPRYPVHKNDYRELILADESHNNWFFEAVSSWARQTNIEKFSEYMRLNSENIWDTFATTQVPP